MATFEEQRDEFLAHAGVKGMKWGKRRNPGYSDQQIKRDTQVYGNRGAKRINSNLNKGDQISTARGDEKTRRDRVIGKNKYIRQGGKLVGGAASGAVGFVAMRAIGKAAATQAGQTLIRKLAGVEAGGLISMATNSLAVQGVVAAGAAKVGYMLAGDAAVAANMKIHGYDPSRR